MPIILIIFIAFLCNIYMFKNSEEYIFYFFWSVFVVVGFTVVYFLM